MKSFYLFIASIIVCLACNLQQEDAPVLDSSEEEPSVEEPEMPPVTEEVFFRGADLSYVNEMEDCGAIYLDTTGAVIDPFELMQEQGANLVRVRLWHTPDWTAYSDEKDVTNTIRRAKAAGMAVLLDFHYSDDWADPHKQEVPKAWLPVVNDLPILSDSIYNYTYGVLQRLHQQGLLPELVQVGNEINIDILQAPGSDSGGINWARNAALLNRGIAAVRDAAATFGTDIGIMLHVAQPENALWWFAEAAKHGVTDFNWMGLSYYPKWSTYPLDRLPEAIQRLLDQYPKRLMVVETAYPFTLANVDAANNILGEDALIQGYPATQQGQLNYLTDLKDAIQVAGGEGLLYWEPAWVSTSCSTRWGQGSHWDNATLFDAAGRPTAGMEFFLHH